MPDQPPDPNEILRAEFLTPRSRYRGEFTPENLVFDANLQEFASRVALLCGLESGGKISPQDAYDQIKDLWQQLREAKHNLLDREPPAPPDLPPE